MSKFAEMTRKAIHIVKAVAELHVIRDMSDCYTWSFPEFVPFCAHLYDFSNFKDFSKPAQA